MSVKGLTVCVTPKASLTGLSGHLALTSQPRSCMLGARKTVALELVRVFVFMECRENLLPK